MKTYDLLIQRAIYFERIAAIDRQLAEMAVGKNPGPIKYPDKYNPDGSAKLFKKK